MLLLYGREKGLRHARKHLGWYLDRLVAEIDETLRTAIMTGPDPQAVVTALRQAFDPSDAAPLRQAA